MPNINFKKIIRYSLILSFVFLPFKSFAGTYEPSDLRSLATYYNASSGFTELSGTYVQDTGGLFTVISFVVSTGDFDSTGDGLISVTCLDKNNNPQGIMYLNEPGNVSFQGATVCKEVGGVAAEITNYSYDTDTQITYQMTYLPFDLSVKATTTMSITNPDINIAIGIGFFLIGFIFMIWNFRKTR